MKAAVGARIPSSPQSSASFTPSPNSSPLISERTRVTMSQPNPNAHNPTARLHLTRDTVKMKHGAFQRKRTEYVFPNNPTDASSSSSASFLASTTVAPAQSQQHDTSSHIHQFVRRLPTPTRETRNDSTACDAPALSVTAATTQPTPLPPLVTTIIPPTPPSAVLGEMMANATTPPASLAVGLPSASVSGLRGQFPQNQANLSLSSGLDRTVSASRSGSRVVDFESKQCRSPTRSMSSFY